MEIDGVIEPNSKNLKGGNQMKSLSVGLGVILIGLIIFVCGEVRGAEDETRYSCNKIQMGMTQDEVLNLLGFPNDRRSESPSMKGRSSGPRTRSDSRGPFDLRGTNERWLYNRPDKLPLNILFIDGKVMSCQE